MSQNWDMIRELAWSDFKLRYKGSLLGFLWSFIKPLLMLLVLYGVFSLILTQKIDHYILFLLLGIILWNFFVESTNISMSNILAKRELLKAVYFPRKNLVISSCLNALFTLVFNFAVFSLFLIFFRIQFNWVMLFFVIPISLLYILSLGVSYIISALYVKYRDIVHIWEVVLQVGFWITPIIYSIKMIPAKYINIYMMNPLARIIDDSRDIIIYGKSPELLSIIITALISIIIYVIGYYIYKKKSDYFAEDL